MKRINIAALLVVVTLLAFGCKKEEKKPEEEVKATAVVKVAKAELKDFVETLSLDGQVVAFEGGSARVAPMVAGRITKVLVKEGDTVEAGQMLALVDTRIQQGMAESASRAKDVAEAVARQSSSALVAATADVEVQIRIAKAGIETAIADRDASVKQAEIEVQRLRNGARPQEVSQQEQVVIQARITRDRAKVQSARDAKLLAEGYVSGQDADTSRAAYQLSESALKQAEEQLSLVKNGARDEEKKAAEERLKAAKVLGDKRVYQANLALKQAQQGELGLRAKMAESSASSMAVGQKAFDASAAKDAVKNGEVRSPFKGVVSRRMLSAGDSSDPNTPIFELNAITGGKDFLAQVSPKDAALIKVGMEIEFSSGSGQVRAVGVANSQTGMVPVRVTYPNSSTPQGVFETAKAHVRDLKGIVTVPLKAILRREDKTVVFVQDGTKAKLVTVELGPTDDEVAVIRKGISKGQMVILLGGHELSDGGAIEVEKG